MIMSEIFEQGWRFQKKAKSQQLTLPLSSLFIEPLYVPYVKHILYINIITFIWIYIGLKRKELGITFLVNFVM
jgi:hypothetical protein